MSEKINPIREFVDHQKNAANELGQALLSLLPEGFREHSNNAFKESREGFQVVAEAANDEVKKNFDEVKKNFDEVKKNVEKYNPFAEKEAKTKVEVQ